MKIEFKPHYVPEGSLEFDEHGRWRIDVYMFASFKTLPQYESSKVLFKDSFPIVIGSIFQAGSTIGNVPSTMHRFAALIPSMENCLSTGASLQSYFYDNDLENLKKVVKNKLNELHSVFKYAK